MHTAELDENGQKTRTFVYQGDQMLAWQQKTGTTENITWEHRDASNATVRFPGILEGEVGAELEPMGSAAPTHLPLIYPWQQEPSLSETRSYPALAEMLGGRCIADGIDIPCGMAMSLLQNGAGRLCPNNDCWVQPIRKSPARRPLPGLNPFAGPSMTERYGDTDWAQHSSSTIAFSSTPNQFSGPSVLGHFTPQDDLKPLARDQISSLMDDILNLFEKNPGCEEWTNKLLTELRGSTGTDAGNVRDIIKKFRDEGTVYTDGRITGINGSGEADGAFGHSPTVFLGYGKTKERTAVTLLHEILHVAGARYEGGRRISYYSDSAMTPIWHKLGVIISPEDYRRLYPDVVEYYRRISNGSDYVNSRLAGAAQNIVCLNAKLGVRTLP